ncbi:MAG: hypothetical protein ABH886_00560 [Candidatus Desantisbacteria bacterium]
MRRKEYLSFLRRQESRGTDTQRHRLEKGVTLIEILIAGIILTVTVITVQQIFFAGSRNVVSTANNTIAVSLCQEGLEIIREMDTQNIPVGTFPPDASPNFPLATYGTVTVGMRNGTRTVSVRAITDTEAIGTATSYLEIMVKIDWEEAGRIKTRYLVTYKR